MNECSKNLIRNQNEIHTCLRIKIVVIKFFLNLFKITSTIIALYNNKIIHNIRHLQ